MEEKEKTAQIRFKIKSSSKPVDTKVTGQDNLEYIFNSRVGHGTITFTSANIQCIMAKTNSCLYIPFEVSKNGIKPSLDVPETLINDKTLETLRYYFDTSQKFSVFFTETTGKNVLYSAFPFSYAFDEVEDDVKNCIIEAILTASTKECKEIAIPLYLTDKIHLEYEAYKRTIVEGVLTALRNTEIDVILFSENERLEWEIIDNL